MTNKTKRMAEFGAVAVVTLAATVALAGGYYKSPNEYGSDCKLKGVPKEKAKQNPYCMEGRGACTDDRERKSKGEAIRGEGDLSDPAKVFYVYACGDLRP